MQTYEQTLQRLLKTVTGPDETSRQAAHQKWNDCAKPLGSLGLLETAVESIAALTGNAQISLFPRSVLLLCADNGVVAQGVTQSPSEVTAIVTSPAPSGRRRTMSPGARARPKQSSSRRSRR